LLGLLGLALLAGLAAMAFSYLSLTYAESLSHVAWSRSSDIRRETPRLLKIVGKRIMGFEERALLMLVRANFKHDTQFRMGVLGFLPLIIFYMIYGFIVAGSNVRDPLNPLPDTQAMTNVLLGLAVVIMPAMMLSLMHTSKSWSAAWIFYTAPFDRVKMIRAIDRLVLMMLVVPICILMCAIFIYLYGNVLHALLHTAFMMTVAATGLTFLNIFDIRLPFAADSRPGGTMGGMLGPMILAAAIFGTIIAIVANVGYGGYLGWGIYMAAFLIFNFLLSRGRVGRIRKVSATWEFTG
jgi:hypothetical protein